MVIVAGIGSGTGVGADEIVGIVRRAETLAGLRADCLAAPWFRDPDAARQAARELGMAFAFVPEAAMKAAAPRCPTRSDRALAAHGVASVAEGCALAACGPDSSLLLPRIAAGRLTCALAATGGLRR